MNSWADEITVTATAAQAVFSVLAIIAAGRIAKRERKETRSLVTEQRYAEDARAAAAMLVVARDHAIALLPEISEWEAQTERWRSALDWPNGRYPLLWGERDEAGQPRIGLSLPPVLHAMTGRFREFGPAADTIQQTVVTFIALQTRRKDLFKAAVDVQLLQGEPAKIFMEAKPFVQQYCDHVSASIGCIRKLIRWEYGS